MCLAWCAVVLVKSVLVFHVVMERGAVETNSGGRCMCAPLGSPFQAGVLAGELHEEARVVCGMPAAASTAVNKCVCLRSASLATMRTTFSSSSFPL